MPVDYNNPTNYIDSSEAIISDTIATSATSKYTIVDKPSFPDFYSIFKIRN